VKKVGKSKVAAKQAAASQRQPASSSQLHYNKIYIYAYSI